MSLEVQTFMTNDWLQGSTHPGIEISLASMTQNKWIIK